ncbi:MAG: glycosyltransferase [Acidobacteriota bacterium]
MTRILLTGANWYGSNARSCADSLRRLGCDVLDIDEETFFPPASVFSSRVAWRLLRSKMSREFNSAILNAARTFRYDFFLSMKGTHIERNTLRVLAQAGRPLYNFYPDTSAFQFGHWLPEALPEYDCVFYTKPFWYNDVASRITLKSAHFIPHGFDPVLHRSFPLNNDDRRDYACDVSFIATFTSYKESVLAKLVRLRPNINLSIWGDRWTRKSTAPELRKHIKGFPLLGERYSRAVQSARINLAIMSGIMPGASSGDLTTSRTYTIPACGGFMLHERNDEVLGLYTEGTEIACFASPEELATMIDHYLAVPEERETIARAGQNRCVPAYSYDNRMADLLHWHTQHYPLISG